MVPYCMAPIHPDMHNDKKGAKRLSNDDLNRPCSGCILCGKFSTCCSPYVAWRDSFSERMYYTLEGSTILKVTL